MNAVLVVSGLEFIVPAQHLERLSRFPWRVKRGYARTRRRPSVALHQMIVAFEGWPSEGFLIDHINGNLQDNRLENLRLVNAQQNACNKRIQKNNTSGFRGVTRDKKTGLWDAYIKVNRKKRRLGRFTTPEEASQVYELAAQEAFGAYYRPLEHARRRDS